MQLYRLKSGVTAVNVFTEGSLKYTKVRPAVIGVGVPELLVMVSDTLSVRLFDPVLIGSVRLRPLLAAPALCKTVSVLKVYPVPAPTPSPKVISPVPSDLPMTIVANPGWILSSSVVLNCMVPAPPATPMDALLE